MLGLKVDEAVSVTRYLRLGLGLAEPGELASALAKCPAMLLYNVPDNLDRKASNLAGSDSKMNGVTSGTWDR